MGGAVLRGVGVRARGVPGVGGVGPLLGVGRCGGPGRVLEGLRGLRRTRGTLRRVRPVERAARGLGGPLPGLRGRPGRGGAAGQGRGRGSAPLLDQGRRGELARFVRQIAPGDGDRPLAGDVVPRSGAALGGALVRGVLEGPLPGGLRVVGEAVPARVAAALLPPRVVPGVPVRLPLLRVPRVPGVRARGRLGPARALGGRAPFAVRSRLALLRGRRDGRRHVAVAGRGERGVRGEQGVDAALGELDEGGGTVVVVALGQRLPGALGASRRRSSPCCSSVTTVPSPVLAGPARPRCAAGAVRRAAAAPRCRPRPGRRRGCRPRRRSPRRRSAPRGRARGCCPSR